MSDCWSGTPLLDVVGHATPIQLDVVGHAPILRPTPERLPVRRAAKNRIRHRVLRHDERHPMQRRRDRSPDFLSGGNAVVRHHGPGLPRHENLWLPTFAHDVRTPSAHRTAVLARWDTSRPSVTIPW